MKSIFSRGICFLLSILLLTGVLPLPVLAADDQLPIVQDVQINPLYRDSQQEVVDAPLLDEPAFYTTDPPVFTSLEDAGAYLRQGMVARASPILFSYQIDRSHYNKETYSDDVIQMMRNLFAIATDHTGVSDEGDYLVWQYEECHRSVKGSLTTVPGYLFLTFTYTVDYYTTYEQELEVTDTVEAVLESLNPDNLSDYQKVKALYDYICQNVSYDYDSPGKLKHTAYAALINRTAVCQGYALLLYRFCLEMDIDCRLIAGDTSQGGHGWNIIKLGGLYYNADATWDAVCDPYRWFLVNQANFPDHNRGTASNYADPSLYPFPYDYDCAEFHAAYPMADTNFDISTLAQGSCGDGIRWTLDSDGLLTITGTGSMENYSSQAPAPWDTYAASIREIRIDGNTDHIGDCAFGACDALWKVAFLGDAPTFGESVFPAQEIIVEYPMSGSGWDTDNLGQFGDNLTWKAFCTVHNYEATVTAPTCLGRGYTTYTCSCGDTYNSDFTTPTGHSFTNYISNEDATCNVDGTATAKCDNCSAIDTITIPFSQLYHNWIGASCTDPEYCSLCGTTRGQALTHNFENGICGRCGAPDPDYVPPTTQPEPTDPKPTDPETTEPESTEPESTEPEPTEPAAPAPSEPQPTEPEVSDRAPERIAGENRFQTAFQVADQLKQNLGLSQFDTIILASGSDFADALSGSYLAAARKAPILLGYTKGDFNQQAADYIIANLAEGGTVYILGGTNAIPSSMEVLLSGLNVVRLAGDNRFETNRLVLQEAGVKPGEEILVATGTDFADCLSASATGKPILLVYKRLLDSQKEYLLTLNNSFCVIGGENAVSEDIAAAISAYGKVERLAGANRLETSVLVAQRYFDNPGSAVVAYGWNYPDGLCGGPLANSMGAPLILTHPKEKHYTIAAQYCESAGINSGFVLGGDGLIGKDAVNAIF